VNSQRSEVKTFGEVRGYCAGYQAAIDYLDSQVRSVMQALADRLRADAEATLREFERQQLRRTNRTRRPK